MFARLVTLVLLALSVATAGAVPASPACAERERLRPIDRANGLSANYAPRALVPLAAFDVPVLGNRGVQLEYSAASAYARMIGAARASGVQIVAISGYRSYDEQRYTFYRWIQWEIDRAAEAGETMDPDTAAARANRYSARAGFSEHQLGTALDVSSREIDLDLTAALAETAAGRWLAAHAHEYGWVSSYPPGKEALTTYNAEPWHLRYVGPQVAAELARLHYLDPNTPTTVNAYLAARPAPACSSDPPRQRSGGTHAPRDWPDRYGD